MVDGDDDRDEFDGDSDRDDDVDVDGDDMLLLVLASRSDGAMEWLLVHIINSKGQFLIGET